VHLSEGFVKLDHVLEHLHAVKSGEFPGAVGQLHGISHSALNPFELGTANLGGCELFCAEVQSADATGRSNALSRFMCIETATAPDL
jgi:hypothetical protein